MISSLTIDWLQILGSGVTSYTLQELEGFDAPDVRLNAYEKPGEDGGRVSAAYYGNRTISLSGIVSGADAATYEQARRNLASVCRVRRDSSTGYPEPVTISFTSLAGTEYTVEAYIKSFKQTTDNIGFGRFLIVMVVPDPLLYGIDNLTTGQFGIRVPGGVTYPITYPAIYGTSTGGTASVNNYGNADSWPILTIRGVATNPTIYAIELGKTFQLTLSATSASDVIVIDMANKTVLYNGGSVLNAKSVDSEWFSLPSGITTFSFSSSSTSDTGTLEVTANPAYIGL